MTWIGVDFDGTLATYQDGQYPRLGEPVPAIVERVKAWLADGVTVRIFSNRAHRIEDVSAVHDWCLKHIGVALQVTACKDHDLVELWDDCAHGVVRNTGERRL